MRGSRKTAKARRTALAEAPLQDGFKYFDTHSTSAAEAEKESPGGQSESKDAGKKSDQPSKSKKKAKKKKAKAKDNKASSTDKTSDDNSQDADAGPSAVDQLDRLREQAASSPEDAATTEAPSKGSSAGNASRKGNGPKTQSAAKSSTKKSGAAAAKAATQASADDEEPMSDLARAAADGAGPASFRKPRPFIAPKDAGAKDGRAKDKSPVVAAAKPKSTQAAVPAALQAKPIAPKPEGRADRPTGRKAGSGLPKRRDLATVDPVEDPATQPESASKEVAAKTAPAKADDGSATSDGTDPSLPKRRSKTKSSGGDRKPAAAPAADRAKAPQPDAGESPTSGSLPKRRSSSKKKKKTGATPDAKTKTSKGAGAKGPKPIDRRGKRQTDAAAKNATESETASPDTGEEQAETPTSAKPSIEEKQADWTTAERSRRKGRERRKPKPAKPPKDAPAGTRIPEDAASSKPVTERRGEGPRRIEPLSQRHEKAASSTPSGLSSPFEPPAWTKQPRSRRQTDEAADGEQEGQKPNAAEPTNAEQDLADVELAHTGAPRPLPRRRRQGGSS